MSQSQKANLAIAVLRTLQACDGIPMPESALVSAVQLGQRHAEPTATDVMVAVRDVEAEGLAQGISDTLTGKSWTLTEKGSHRAKQLR